MKKYFFIYEHSLCKYLIQMKYNNAYWIDWTIHLHINEAPKFLAITYIALN